MTTPSHGPSSGRPYSSRLDEVRAYFDAKEAKRRRRANVVARLVPDLDRVRRVLGAGRANAAGSRRLRARRAMVPFAALVLVLVGAVAWAAWPSVGTGTVVAQAATMNAPTGVNASSTTGSGTVSVSWTAPTGSVAPTGYRVTRTVSGGSPVAACGTASTTISTLTCSDTGVSDGTYTYRVVAVRGGWTATSSPSASVTVVNTIATTTSVSASPTSSVVGQQVTYTATVQSGSGTNVPSGTVSFSDGSSAIVGCGSKTVTAGQATCSVTYTAPGAHQITAAYSGATPYGSSTSGTTTQTVSKATTSTSLTADIPSSQVDQPVVFTATVSVATGAGTPGGSVTFSTSAGNLSCTNSSQAVDASTGKATCTTSFGSVGNRSVTALYSGDTNFVGSSSNGTQSVVAGSTTTTLTSSTGGTSAPGQSVTYTATVTPAYGNGNPTGSVTFKDGTAAVACGTNGVVTMTSGTRTALCTLTYSSAGSHQIVATYGGSSTYNASPASASLTQTVAQISTTTGLTLTTGSPARSTSTITFTAQVNNLSSTTSGTVAFKDGSTTIASCGTQAVNSSGVATCQVAAGGLSTGAHSITAVFSGDAMYATSSSGAQTQRVVNGNVAGIGFVNVKVSDKNGANFTTVAPSCTANSTIGTTSYLCTVNGPNNASLQTDFAFINGSGVATNYTASGDISSTLSWRTSVNPATNNASIAAGATSTSGTPTATVTQSGNSGASITVTFSDGVNSFQAIIKIQ